MKHPDNTPLEEWLSIWLFHEVERIVDSHPPKGQPKSGPFKYTGMSLAEKEKAGLPRNREQAIAFIKEHRKSND